MMLLKPCNGYVTSFFGMRYHPVFKQNRLHTGVDYGSHPNDDIYAVADGIVRSSTYEKAGFGHYIIIDHVINGQHISTVYAHLANRKVLAGQRVKRGQVIGLKGNTGTSTAKHLHFEVHVGGWAYANGNKPNAVNPLLYVVDPDIKALQANLRKIGIIVDVDGLYGKDTQEAIGTFQLQNGLTVDKYVGKATFDMLADKMASLKKEETTQQLDKVIDNISEAYIPSSSSLISATQNVLEQMGKSANQPISDEWIEKLNQRKLTTDEAIGLLFVAINRGKLN